VVSLDDSSDNARGTGGREGQSRENGTMFFLCVFPPRAEADFHDIN